MPGPVGNSTEARRREISFPPYRLDLDAGLLRAGARTISLRPKTWGVLRYLAARPGILVSKEELLDAVWKGIAVTESTLTKSIGEIRDALHDDVRHPRFVETVHRRGFRFVRTVEVDAALPRGPADTTSQRPAHLVAREPELERIERILQSAATGKRQMAFVTGEGGIGKTTLIQAVAASIAARSGPERVCIVSGQCVRRHGGEEPLMPVLEALGRLARGPEGARVVRLLHDRAPGWLVQLPWLIGADDLQELRVGLVGTTPDRMLRVFAQLLEELTTDLTLVLVLEDLHWADASTVDLLSVLAERSEPARLLVLGTYRPAEVITRGGPFDRLRRVLALKGRSTEIALDVLSSAAVHAYLTARFGGRETPAGLAPLLHTQTAGNPLFLVTAVNFLVARGLVLEGERGARLGADLDTLERHIPGSLQELVELQVHDLEPFEVAVIEAASVAGLEFGAQTVAAALDTEPEQVEDACERLVRSQRLLRPSDTEAWPDGAVAGRYAFAHALYQRVLYHRLPVGRRRSLHQRIGERLEAGFGSRANEVAAELAVHFERGREPPRAIRWLEAAAATAGDRFAPREAAGYLRRALTLFERTLDLPERSALELRLRSALGAAVMATAGFAADEAWQNLLRAYDLATDVGATIDRYRIAYMLANLSNSAADPEHLPRRLHELVTSAEQVGTDAARAIAAMLATTGAVFNGRLRDARELATLSKADPDEIGRLVPGENIAVWATGFDGWRRWLIGEPDRARAAAQACVRSARSRPNPSDLAMAIPLAAQVHLWRGDLAEATLLVDEGRRLSSEQGFALWLAALQGIAGMLHLARGDAAAAVADLRAAVEAYRATGVRVHVPILIAGLGQALLAADRRADGFTAVDEGFELTWTTLCQWQAPELWRVRGELLAAERSRDAEFAFEQALDIAHVHGSLAFELRAATALARWLVRDGRAAAALSILAPRYAAFTEGHETTDLRAARELLAGLFR